MRSKPKMSYEAWERHIGRWRECFVLFPKEAYIDKDRVCTVWLERCEKRIVFNENSHWPMQTHYRVKGSDYECPTQ